MRFANGQINRQTRLHFRGQRRSVIGEVDFARRTARSSIRHPRHGCGADAHREQDRAFGIRIQRAAKRASHDLALRAARPVRTCVRDVSQTGGQSVYHRNRRGVRRIAHVAHYQRINAGRTIAHHGGNRFSHEQIYDV